MKKINKKTQYFLNKISIEDYEFNLVSNLYTAQSNFRINYTGMHACICIWKTINHNNMSLISKHRNVAQIRMLKPRSKSLFYTYLFSE